MDTGKGVFVMLDEGMKKEILEQKHPDHGGWFRVDEIVELKGSRFRVKAVKPTELRLKLLPREKAG